MEKIVEVQFDEHAFKEYDELVTANSFKTLDVSNVGSAFPDGASPRDELDVESREF